MTHAIHMLIVNADSREDARSFVARQLKGWGSENNYHYVCAVLSEDGRDDELDYPFEGWPAHWGYDFLDTTLSDGETYFRLAIQEMKKRIYGPIYLQAPKPYTYHECDETSAAEYLAEQASRFRPGVSPSSDLLRIKRNSEILFRVLESREQIRHNPDRFEFWGERFNEPGLTDYSDGSSSGRQKYIVLIDMHS